MSLSTRIASALAECDALALAAERASVEARRAHTSLQAACAACLVEVARVKRELREIDADLTPVRGVSQGASHVPQHVTRSGARVLRRNEPGSGR